jgi:hypothetical protein
MSGIPEELQKLWASRDRSADVAVIPTITLEDSDEVQTVGLDSLDFLEPDREMSVSPITPPYSVTDSIPVFPTYKIVPPSINIASYEPAYDKRLRRSETT